MLDQLEWMACNPMHLLSISYVSPGMLDQLEWMAVAMKTQRDAHRAVGLTKPC